MNTELPKWTEQIGRENHHRASLRWLVNHNVGSWLLLYWQTPSGSAVNALAADVLTYNGVYLNPPYEEKSDVLAYARQYRPEVAAETKSLTLTDELQARLEELMVPIEHQPIPTPQPDPERVWLAYKAGYIKSDRARELVDIEHPIYRRLMEVRP